MFSWSPRALHKPYSHIQSQPYTCTSSNGPPYSRSQYIITSLCVLLSSKPCSDPFLQIRRSFRSSPKMMLKAASSLSLLKSNSENFDQFSSSATYSSIVRASKAVNGGNGAVVVAVSKSASQHPITGVVFEPFEEVKELMLTPASPQESLARQRLTDEVEAAINEQINVEYNVSYVYHALYAYFDRDNVALKGLAKFFKDSSVEEREHAEKLMEYQNKRGGKVKLQSIVSPPSEFDHPEKGDALYAMELALSLEKLVNGKLLHLHSVAERNNDVNLTDFVEGEYLNEQVEAIKKISEYVAQLRRVGKGHGVWHFDQMLLA